MHTDSCLGISPKYLIFRNAPKPIIDLCGISFLCANFETFTIFSAIALKTCTYPPNKRVRSSNEDIKTVEGEGEPCKLGRSSRFELECSWIKMLLKVLDVRREAKRFISASIKSKRIKGKR